jgi:hypothetical protein
VPHEERRLFSALATRACKSTDRLLGGYVVRDAPGQIVVWVYARASTAEAMRAKILTLDGERRIATNIARLPELLRRDER